MTKNEVSLKLRVKCTCRQDNVYKGVIIHFDGGKLVQVKLDNGVIRFFDIDKIVKDNK